MHLLKLIERIGMIEGKKMFAFSFLVLLFEFIYCGVKINDVGLSDVVMYILFIIFSYFPIIIAKLNILTGAYETMMKGWKKYLVVYIIGLPIFFCGLLFFIILLIKRDFDFANLVFIAPLLLHYSCKSVILYNEEDKNPPKWSW